MDSIMRHLPLNRIYDGMCLPANMNILFQVLLMQAFQRIKKTRQPCSQWSISCAFNNLFVSNSPSRLRSGFSPSVVRKSVHLETIFPLKCRIRIAMLFESSFDVQWKSSSFNWSNVFSPCPFNPMNRSRTTRKYSVPIDIWCSPLVSKISSLMYSMITCENIFTIA